MKQKPEFDRIYQDHLQYTRMMRLKDRGVSQATIDADNAIYEKEINQAKAAHDALTNEQYWDRQATLDYFSAHGAD